MKKGDKSHFWKGGICDENKLIRNSLDYKIWRDNVFNRDNYICQSCSASGVYINAYHIKGFFKYPELRYKIDNGVTLCIKCHKETDNYAGKIRN